MENKILVLSFSLLAFSSSEVLAVGAADGLVYTAVDLSWNELVVTGGISSYDSYSYSMAKTADYWDITQQSGYVFQYFVKNTDSLAQSSINVGEYETATAHGQTTAGFITSQSAVELWPGYYGAYSAEARAQQGLAYQVTSAGTVTFSIPYSLSASVLDSNNDNSEYAYTRAWSWLSLWTGEKWSVIDGTYSEALSGNGSLNISYTAAAGSFLKFEAGADTRVAILNPVPVPPSVLMLLTGCTSLFFMKRRKS